MAENYEEHRVLGLVVAGTEGRKRVRACETQGGGGDDDGMTTVEYLGTKDSLMSRAGPLHHWLHVIDDLRRKNSH